MPNSQIDERANRMEGAAVESGNQALKALLLLNGGACIAILGFLASTFAATNLDPDRARLVGAFISALGLFSWGAGAAVAASGLAYLTNSYYARAFMPDPKPNDYKKAVWLNKSVVVVSLISLGLFCVGVYAVQMIY